MEHRFLFQLGESTLIRRESMMTQLIIFLNLSLLLLTMTMIGLMDIKGLSKAYYGKKKLDKSIEYGLKAANTFQRIGALNEYADLQVQLAAHHLENLAPDRSLKILIKLEQFAATNGSRYYEAKSLLEQSLILKTKGETSKYKDALNKGRSIANSIGAKDLLLIE